MKGAVGPPWCHAFRIIPLDLVVIIMMMVVDVYGNCDYKGGGDEDVAQTFLTHIIYILASANLCLVFTFYSAERLKSV